MRHVVFISYFFHPNTEIASERALKYVHSLSSLVEKVTVLTIDLKNINSSYLSHINRASTLKQNVEIQYVKPRFKWLVHCFRTNRKYLNLWFRLIHKLLASYIIGDAIGVTWNHKLHGKLSMINKKERIDLIVVSLGPFSSMYKVAQYARHNNIKYILDYRDLWINNPHFKLNFYAKYYSQKCEKYAMEGAYKITAASNGLAQYFINKYNFRDIHVLYNLVDKNFINYYKNIVNDNVYKVKSFDDSKLNLYFAGTLYGNGPKLDVFINALLQMPEENRKHFNFHIFGNSRDLVQKFNQAGLGEILFTYGRVCKEEAIYYMSMADVLISLINNQHITNNEYQNGVMSAKIFEYIITNKPIINISSKDAEINLFTYRINYEHFYSFSLIEVEQLSMLLKSLLSSKKCNLLSNNSSRDYNIYWETQFISEKIL